MFKIPFQNCSSPFITDNQCKLITCLNHHLLHLSLFCFSFICSILLVLPTFSFFPEFHIYFSSPTALSHSASFLNFANCMSFSLFLSYLPPPTPLLSYFLLCYIISSPFLFPFFILPLSFLKVLLPCRSSYLISTPLLCPHPATCFFCSDACFIHPHRYTSTPF